MFFMNAKKALFVIGFIILVIAFGALIYFVFIKDLVTPPTGNENVNAGTNTNGTGGLPIINGVTNTNQGGVVSNTNRLANLNRSRNVNQGGVDTTAKGGTTLAKAETTQQVAFAAPGTTGSGLRYYDNNEGKFFRLDPNGNPQELSNQIFPKAKDIAWSPKGNKAIITFPDESKVMYDFDQQSQVTIPKEWDDVQFSPGGDKIAFKNMSSEESSRWLAVSNPDTSEVELIEPLGDNGRDVAINWSPNAQVVALFRQSYSGEAQEAFLIGLHGENFKSLLTEGRGFEGQWSPTGEQLLYNVYNASTNYNPNLFLVDASGDSVGANKIDLGLQTWSSRCAFSPSSPTLYCAVPRSMPLGSGIYPEAATATNDSIYEIDMNTGSKSVLALPTFSSGSRDYAVTSLILSDNEQTLYFTDSVSGNVYSLQLK